MYKIFSNLISADRITPIGEYILVTLLYYQSSLLLWPSLGKFYAIIN